MSKPKMPKLLIFINLLSKVVNEKVTNYWCKILYLKIRLCKIFDKYHVCASPHSAHICSVGDNVLFQNVSLTKWLTLCWAGVGLHSTVDKHVRFQIYSLTKWPMALDTAEALVFLWVIMCTLKCPAQPNDLLHWRHQYASTFPDVPFHLPLQIFKRVKWLLVVWTNVDLVLNHGSSNVLPISFGLML